jgi:hypothetical protein
MAAFGMDVLSVLNYPKAEVDSGGKKLSETKSVIDIRLTFCERWDGK